MSKSFSPLADMLPAIGLTLIDIILIYDKAYLWDKWAFINLLHSSYVFLEVKEVFRKAKDIWLFAADDIDAPSA